MDIKNFKKAYKLICDECGKFAHTKREFCDKCGEKALRKATKEDYTRYEMEKMRDTKVRRIESERTMETRMVAKRAERVTEKAKMVAEKAEKEVKNAAEKTKTKADKN